MKITSASKKVLASALSAAMVVAFAPTVAFGAATQVIKTSEADDAAMAAQGYVAKEFISTASDGTGYKYYKAADINANTASAAYTLISDIKVTATNGNQIVLREDATIDMNGHKIEAADTAAIDTNGKNLTLKTGSVSAAKDLGAIKQVAIVDSTTGANTLTLKNVDVAGDAGAISLGTHSADKVVVENGKLGSINATNAEFSGTVETGKITGAAKVAKKSALTVSTENAVEHSAGDDDGCTDGTYAAKNAATGISGRLTLLEGATATVSATSKAGVATAIANGVQLDKNATVNATAKAVANGQVAQAIFGKVYGDYEGAAVNASAVSAGAAFGIAGADSDTVAMNAGTVSADGVNDANSFAISLHTATGSNPVVHTYGKATLKGGTYTGKLEVAGKNTTTPANGTQITGGKFSKNPEELVDKAKYNVSKGADGMFTVQQFKDFAITGKGYASDDVVAYVSAAAQQMVKGETPAGIQLAEGVTPADFVAQAEKGLKVNVKIGVYNEKTATDAQKAAKTAVDEAIKADLNKVTDPDLYRTVSITVEYDKTGVVEPVVIATVTALGEITDGLGTKQAVLELGEGDLVNPYGTVYAVNDGKAAKVAWKKNVDGKNVNKIELASIPTLFAYSVMDEDAVKDAAQKGEEAAETITDPAVLAMITALQDENAVSKVSGKTKTVKKGKSATVKLGVPASKSGAKVTFKKANTAGKKNITVSKAGTVTVKKALKKGTYKVKVKATCGESFKNVYVKIIKK